MGEPPAPAAPEDGAAGPDALLATKLHVPRARHGLVPRPRLVDRLTEALAGELTVVCAPAGFGKTALLADWARRSGRPVAWLSLDAADNDPVRFWRHVAAALGGMRAAAGQRITALLGPPPSCPPPVTCWRGRMRSIRSSVPLSWADRGRLHAVWLAMCLALNGMSRCRGRHRSKGGAVGNLSGTGCQPGPGANSKDVGRLGSRYAGPGRALYNRHSG